VQAKTSSSGLEMLSQIPEDRSGGETQFQRIELFALLCEHATTEAAEGRRISGKKDRKRYLEGQTGVGVHRL